MRAKARLHARAHQLAREVVDVALQVGQADLLVDVEPFDLVEVRRMRRVGRVAPVAPPGQTIRTGGLRLSMYRACTALVCVRQQQSAGR
jgi:hypothetical protein